MKKILMLLCILMLSACASKEEVYTALPTVTIGIAPIQQTLDDTKLLAGYFPENRQLASTEELAVMNAILKDALLTLERPFTFLKDVPSSALLPLIEANSTKGNLAYWIAYGQYNEVDLLILPELFYFNNIDSPNSNYHANALMLDFYLIDTRGKGMLLKRSHFAEEEQSTDGSGLGMLAFSKRIGKDSMQEILIEAYMLMADEFEL